MKYYLFEGENHGVSIVFDASALTPESIEQAIVLDELPMPEERMGFKPVLRGNQATKEVWYEYVKLFPVEETSEEII